MNIIVIGDLGQRIPNLPKQELGHLIQEMRDPASEDPYRTLVRHFAGDITHDIATRLGEPISRQLHINEKLASFSIVLEYPEEFQQKTIGREGRVIQGFIEERKQYWLKQYEDGLRNRAVGCGDEVTKNALKM